MDIITKARELGELIAASEQMASFNKAEEAMQNDSRAKTLFNDYKLLQIEVVKATKEKRPDDITQSIKDRLMAKLDEINNYTVTKDYLQAKAEVDRLMKTVNDVIIYSITGEEPCSPSKCGSCGGGCK